MEQSHGASRGRGRARYQCGQSPRNGSESSSPTRIPAASHPAAHTHPPAAHGAAAAAAAHGATAAPAAHGAAAHCAAAAAAAHSGAAAAAAHGAAPRSVAPRPPPGRKRRSMQTVWGLLRGAAVTLARHRRHACARAARGAPGP